MNEEVKQDDGSAGNAEFKVILRDSLLGTAGLMWVLGGALMVYNLYDLHWVIGWIAAFVWIWGCWAAALYFDVKRYFS